MLTDEEVAYLLRRRTSPLNINEAIEILETKIKWCESVLTSDDFKSEELKHFAQNRVGVEKTTIEECLAILKRVKKYPHDLYNKETN